jgi:hypothetical protein
MSKNVHFLLTDVVSDDPLTEGTKPYEIAKEIRKRSGLKLEVQPLSCYMDKL